jgi:GAF domain-containing protein
LTGYFDEQARLTVLAEHDVEAAGHDVALDSLTGLAAEICGVPVCLVSLVGSDYQHFIARTGLTEARSPRDASFCQHAMLERQIMVVPDALADPRFAKNPLVLGAPHVRFYAGAPLHSSEGVPLGALCIIDDTPRDGLTPLQARALNVLAAQVMAALEARRRTRQRATSERAFEQALIERENRFRVLADSMPQMVWSAQADGRCDYFNAQWYAFTGICPGSPEDGLLFSLIHPEDAGERIPLRVEIVATPVRLG